jgi:hypothetical protein
MGWVEQKLIDYKVTKNHLVGLWNSVRDSAGSSANEFNARIHGSNVKTQVCATRGEKCIRVQKDGEFLEIFINEADQSVRYAAGSKDEVIAAHYRLNSLRDGLEFFESKEDGERLLNAEDICRKALEDFLFTPAPYGRFVTLPGEKF